MQTEVLSPVDINEADDLILDEELSPEDIAEIERLQRQWEADAKREVSQNNTTRENWLSSGMDIVDYAKTHGETPEEIEAIATACGFNSTTWDDARNVKRREAGKSKRVSILAKSAGKAATDYIKSRQNKTAAQVASTPVEDKPAKVKTAPAGILAPAPLTTDREVLEAWAREYCSELCEQYQSAKLVKKLYGGPDNPGGGSLNYQLSIMPERDELLPNWSNSAQLSFDKKVGA